jgi:hypothetical protein
MVKGHTAACRRTKDTASARKASCTASSVRMAVGRSVFRRTVAARTRTDPYHCYADRGHARQTPRRCSAGKGAIRPACHLYTGGSTDLRRCRR